MTTLKQQTVTGIKWLVGSSFLQKGIQLAGTVILARILGPAQFGLFALAFVAIDALSLFKSMGFDSALIQRKEDVGKAANTAFFIIPVLGILLYAILFISSPLIGKFLNNLEVVSVIKALGVIFVISCLGRVPAALLEKNMQFRQVSIIEIGTAIIFSVSAIVFALLKLGVWSLVYAYILKTFYQNILAFICAKWRPRFEFDKKTALEMFHFGKFLFLGGMVWFLKMNLDNLLVGKLLGVTALGLYAVAFNMANFTVDYFGGKVNKVIFPAYSKLQNELYDSQAAVLKTIKFVSIITIPFCIMIFLLSNELLNFIYGEKWINAAGVLRILAWAGIFTTLPTGMGAIFLSFGKPKLSFWINTLQVVLFIMFIVPMAKLFGLLGVGVVVTATCFISFVLTLYFTMKLLSLGINQVWLSFKPALIASILMTTGVIFLKNTFPFQKNLIRFDFLLISTFAMIIYFFTLFITEKSLFHEMRRLIFD